MLLLAHSGKNRLDADFRQFTQARSLAAASLKGFLSTKTKLVYPLRTRRRPGLQRLVDFLRPLPVHALKSGEVFSDFLVITKLQIRNGPDQEHFRLESLGENAGRKRGEFASQFSDLILPQQSPSEFLARFQELRRAGRHPSVVVFSAVESAGLIKQARHLEVVRRQSQSIAACFEHGLKLVLQHLRGSGQVPAAGARQGHRLRKRRTKPILQRQLLQGGQRALALAQLAPGLERQHVQTAGRVEALHRGFLLRRERHGALAEPAVQAGLGQHLVQGARRAGRSVALRILRIDPLVDKALR